MIKKGIEQGYFSQRPIIVPESTDAANLLRSASEELKEMGIGVDFDSNTTIISNNAARNNPVDQADNTFRKIYPNDPCPCGSGKKFKKCCGKQNG